MKKILIAVLVIMILMVGCGVTVTEYDNAVEAKTVIEQSTEGGDPFYVLRLELKQQHTILNLDKMIKDELNKFEFDIPVDKRYYDSLEIGDEIVDEFRMGSVIIDGSFGSWKCTVVGKGIIE